MELLVLVAVLAVASAFALWRRRTDGRLTPVRPEPSRSPADARLTAEDLGAALGERATLVQFSTAFCQPCRATRAVLGDVAASVPGVRHVEVDAESHLDLVRRLDVRRTPTVLVLDADGQVVQRATGAPRKAQVLAVLDGVVTA